MFVFVFLPSYIPHLSMHLEETTIKRSVDDLKLLDDQRRKSARIIYFCHRRGVDFACAKAMTLVATKEECFRKIAVFLYN